MSPNNIYDEYEKYTINYKREYGEKTVVFMIVGSFMELYCANDGLVDMKTISEILKIQISRRDKKITEVSRSNYNMMGFPEYTLMKFVKLMTDQNWTVVVVGPTEPGSRPQKRAVTDIFSPSTIIDQVDSYETNNLMSLYLQEISVHKSHKKLLVIGVSIIDLSTGVNYTYEVSSTLSDDMLSLDTCYRLITIHNPREILIFGDVTIYDIEYITKYLDLEARCIHNKLNNYNKEVLKTIYQTRVLQRVFLANSILSPIEYLDLERLPNALVSYVALLQFSMSHNENILSRIQRPNMIMDDNKLIISYNAIKQLNITHDDNTTLLKLLNNCVTSIGKRNFKNKLLNPIYNREELEDRYDMIERFMVNKLYVEIVKCLQDVYDIERIFRKMNLNKLHPMDFSQIDTSFQAILGIYEIMKDQICLMKCIKFDFIGKMEKFIQFYTDTLDFDEIIKYNLQNINANIFKKGLFGNIDVIQEKLDNDINFFQEMCDRLNTTYEQQAKFFRCDYNERDGYYILITSKRFNEIEKKLRGLTLNINGYIVNLQDLIERKVSDVSNLSKIRHKDGLFSTINEQITKNKLKVKEIVSIEYNKFIEKCCEEYKDVFIGTIKLISDTDFYVSNAKNAILYKYTRPHIIDGDKSGFSAKELRHPIIERILHTEYITNNISLGHEMDGMLLYGINSAGKCFKEDTMIMLSNGDSKKVQEIEVGDLLMGDDSTPRKILSLTSGKDVMYEILTTKGMGFTVNSEHILVLKGRNYINHIYDKKNKRWRVTYWYNGNRIIKSFTDALCINGAAESIEYINALKNDFLGRKADIIEISVAQYINKPVDFKSNYYLYTVPIVFSERLLPLDPYWIGLWLGDGTKRNCSVTTIDSEIVEYINQFCSDNNIVSHRYGTNEITYILRGKKKNIDVESNTVLSTMKELNLIYNKHIPDIYLKNSYENRFKLLAGLIDSDGYNSNNNGYEITQKNEKLADDILYLVRSLGFTCYKKSCEKSCTYKGKKITGKYYRMYIYGPQQLYDQVPCLLERKIINKTGMDKSGIISFKIIKQPPAKYYGFQVNGNQRFLLNNFIVTHNSSFMKSVGLAIIMAQSGMWVAASEFTLTPYRYIFSRIPSGDDIFKGQSTFTMEICELRNILKRADKYSIVIGDELCSGTEHTSALSIVGACIIELCDRRCSFICATHLHDIVKLEKIVSLKNLAINHLSIHYDTSLGSFVFDRKLKSGCGDTLYGLEVCKGLDLDIKFLNLANSIRHEILNINDDIVCTKKSHFNAKFYVDKCEICGKIAEEVHHIKRQADSKENYHDHNHKNSLHNLTNLCTECHDKVHNNEIEINGYVQTIDKGTLLNIKNNDNEILCRKNLVLKYKHEKHNNPTIKRLIKDNHNIDISLYMINKFINKK